MIGRKVAFSATVSLCLYSQLLNAQTESNAEKKGEEQASPSSTTDATATPAEAQGLASEPAAASNRGPSGLLGDFRIGPSVALGIPHPVSGGVDIMYADTASLSITAGRFGVNVMDTDLEIRNFDVAARWFPFQGTFFVGAAYGNQGIVGKRKVDLKVTTAGVPLTVPTTLRLEIESNYLTPQIGWFARWDCGFTLGFDIGVQIPSGTKSELQTSFEDVSTAGEVAVRNSDEYKDNKKDVEDAAEAIGKQAIPFINVIRLGWLF